MTYKLIIAGYYGFRNAGDEAILSGMVHKLRQQIPDVEICVVSADPAYTRSIHEVDALDMEDLDALIEQVGRSDAVILGGGGLLHDYWSLKEDHILTFRHVGLAFYLGIILLAYLFERPMMLYAVGVGPLEDLETKDVIRWILSMVDRVTVRDPESARLLGALRLDEGDAWPELFVAADPAFDMPLRPFEDAEAALSKAGLANQPLLAVILRYWEYGTAPDVWQREVANMLDAWIEQHYGNVLFLPFQTLKGTLYEDDSRVCQRVIHEMQNQDSTKLLDFSEDFTLLPGVLSFCDVTLSMRLHGTIFSLLAGTPVASMAYDPKIDALMSMAGLESFNLSRDEWDINNLSSALDDAFSTDIGDVSNSFVLESQEKSNLSISQLLEILEGNNAPVAYVDHKLRDFTLQKVRSLIDRQADESSLELSTYRLADLFLRSQDLLLKMEASRKELINELDNSINDLERGGREKTELLKRIEGFHQEIQDQKILIRGLEAEKSESERQISRLESMRDQLIIDRDQAITQLSQLRDTLAVRLSARYWAVAKRLIPIGSRRRKIYQRFRSLLRGVVKDQTPSFPARGSVHNVENHGDEGLPTRTGPAFQVDETELADSLTYFAERQFEAGCRNVMTIISPTPFVESEGQRAIHLSREFLKKGYAIVYAYWRWNRDLKRQQDRLGEGVFQIPIDEMIESRDELTRVFEDYDEKVMLIEFPYPGLFESLAIAHAAGWITIYDVVDDWEAFHDVGQASWYDDAFEDHLISTADVVLTINEHLSSKVLESGRETFALVPNGVSKDFDQIADPKMLERGEITLGYFGYLSNAWFDWDLVRRVARQHPEWIIYLIGYGDEGEGSRLPSNIRYLGKKPWRSLAAYASNWNVALVPFKTGPVALAADPIKTYEYLSVGLPVVLKGVNPPLGGERLVFCSNNYAEFIENILAAIDTSESLLSARIEFARNSEWSNRAQLLDTILSEGKQRVREKQELFCQQK